GTMKVLAILACIVVGAAVVHGACDELHKYKVQAQWAQIYTNEGATTRTTICKAAFRALFKIEPATRALFSKFDSQDTNSPKFQAHCVRVLGGLGQLFSLLGEPKIFESQLDHLSQYHAKIPNLQIVYFEQLGQALEEIFKRSIEDYDNEAFADCYIDIVKGMTSRIV
ncbi:unnamed protein product, partial [Owenia fusiformis]